MGDDMAVILKELGYEEVDVLGYSLGGGVAFRFAVQHPEMVRRLALVSAGFAQDGFYPEMLPQQAAVGAAMAEFMKDTPMYQSYVAVAPKPEEFPKLLDQMGEWMRTPYDWSEDVKKLDHAGDARVRRQRHVPPGTHRRVLSTPWRRAQGCGWQREHMSRNRLAILPDLTHYEMFLSPRLAATVLPFLNGKSGIGSWAEQVEGSTQVR